MSALAGIFKFDPRDNVRDAELRGLAQGIDRIGPDGGAEYLKGNIGMAYRAFHTTLESSSENQPLVREGHILTWDGRLDNREEIRKRIDYDFEGGTPTDLDLVFAAYKQWGTAAFPELIGDWAIALWDERKQLLFLARDYIGVRRLFYRLDDDGVTWCTIPEPLVLSAKRPLHLDLTFLAGCFYPKPPIEATAYQEIRGVVPGSLLTFSFGGKRATERYWSLNPHGRIRYSSDKEYEAHFLSILKDSVRRRLRSDRAVTAELSGGVDSSSIVCVADEIRKDEFGPSLETVSYYDPEEPSGDERPYFTIIERARGRTGSHISLREFSDQAKGLTLRPLPERYFVATPGYFASVLEWQTVIKSLLDRTGSRIVLSGLGGDELLGGVQYEAPELADYLVERRITSFTRSIMSWSLARKKTVFSLLRDVLHLIGAGHRPRTMLNSSDSPLPWVRLIPGKHVSHRSFTSWSKLCPSKVFLESIRYSLGTQLSCTDPPLVGCLEKRYPYLDRDLYGFLASIPREQVLQPGHRRHLMRRALREIVPHEVLFRKSKWFAIRGVQTALLGDRDVIERMLAEPWISAGQIVEMAQLRQRFCVIEHGVAQDAMLLRAAIGVELWLRSQGGVLNVGVAETGQHSAGMGNLPSCPIESFMQ
jgi:asparagine synthase (glutamine-hydrolysing)